MNTETIAILGLLISTAVTILGWLYTAMLQRRILEESQKSRNLDRELAVFRERLSIIRGVTATLVDLSNPYAELFALIQTGQFTLDSGAAAIRRSDASAPELMKVLNDPGFRSMLKLLPDKEHQVIQVRLDNMTAMLADLHASNLGLSPILPDYADRLNNISNTALAAANELKNVADLLADAFAFLDGALVTGS
jgi:hypothetical protein